MSGFYENLRIAMQGIAANRLRAALTTLGVLIGVASVILLLAVGNGSSAQIEASINKLGTNFLTVSPGSNGFGAIAATLGLGFRGARFGQSANSATLTMADVAALQNKKNNPDIKAAAPVVNASETCVAGSNSYQPTSFVGSTPAYQSARGYSMASGTFISSADVSGRLPVVDIGQTVDAQLFPAGNAVGQTMQCGRQKFTIIGIFNAKGTNGVQDLDSVIVAPYTTVEAELTGFTGGLSSITVEAANSSAISGAEGETYQSLMTLEGITNVSSVNFSVATQASLVSTSTSTSKTFTTLLGAVAAISLLVGGIGVMNIMLVTVTERTREIGIRKAVGATKGAVMTQFLTEAIVLSVIGGALGVAAALVGSHFTIDGVKPVIETWSVFMAFGVAVLIGLFFGAYPANRAASLNPIEALRYE